MNAILEEELDIIKDMYESCKEETSEVILFGSAVDGSRNEQSDIDVLFVAKKGNISALDNSIRKACVSRDLKIGEEVRLEGLYDYGPSFYPKPKTHKFHFLKATKDLLKSNDPTLSSVLSSISNGKNIMEIIND